MSESKAEKLAKLKELKDKGYITEEEFTQQKSDILNDVDKSFSGMLEKFKVFMLAQYPDFSITNSTKTSIDFQKVIPEKKPGCATAIILFLLGILPGIIYYFAAHKNEEIQNIHVVASGNDVIVSGYHSEKIKKQFLQSSYS